jgi:hypothetical protein
MRKPHPSEHIAHALGGPLALELAPSGITMELEPRTEPDPYTCDECYHATGEIECSACRKNGAKCKTHATYRTAQAAMVVAQERRPWPARSDQRYYEMPRLPKSRRERKEK